MKVLISLCLGILFFGVSLSTHSGDLECYGYTSTTSHFDCGDHGNCVWWAAYKRPDIARVVSGSGWNGGEWYDNLRNKGFDVGSQPKVDAIVEFSSPGHVAYVESVESNGSFSVSEMDATGNLGSGKLTATYSPNGDGTYKRNGSGSWTLKGFIYRRQTGTDKCIEYSLCSYCLR